MKEYCEVTERCLDARVGACSTGTLVPWTRLPVEHKVPFCKNGKVGPSW